MSVESSALNSDRSAPRGAVFLSYASQDAEAAQRIAAALRAAGVEVWFDQNELVGGDAWDQKIRGLIKSCALFVPVISAATQARREGYFRLEWKLADDRTHLMARGTPFLVPVCVDDTKDRDALVPDSFTNVQWTRLPGGETPPKFTDRVVQLLAGGAVPPPHQPRPVDRTEPPAATSAAAPANKFPRWALAIGAGAVLGLALYFGLRSGPPAPVPPAAPLPKPAGSLAPAPAFPRDPELGRAVRLIYALRTIAEDFGLAEDIVKPILAARPNDPEVVTVAAQIAQEYVTRGFDTSEARRAQAQRLTERAVQLNPDNPDALAALGRYLVHVGSQLGRAEELMRRAIAINPREPRYHRVLFLILAATKSAEEADAFGIRMAALFPMDPLVNYEIARRYKDADRLELMEEWLDKTLAITPVTVTYAMVWKAWCMLEVHGDVAGMKTWLDRVPDRERSTTRVVNAFAMHAGITGQTEVARQLLEVLADTWLTDFDFSGPKALLVGQLLQIEGRDELARLQFESALAEIKRAEARDPTDLRHRRAEIWAQIGLGHRAEAQAALRVVLQELERPFRWSMRFSWWSSPIRACLLLDQKAQAVALLKQAVAEPTGRLLLRNNFRVDPRMAPFRDDPEITALLAEPEKPKPAGGGAAPAAPPDEKSVAVLAFANLSDDKSNEYFSDGISEELLNVLGRVPGLRVAAPMSAFSFKGKNVSAQEIGQKLNVAFLVNGSVRRAGPEIRVVARLSRADTDEQIWTEKFNGEAKNVFALQDEIAGKIAAALSLKLGASARAAKPIDPEAYRLYLEGRQFWSARSLDALDRAEVAFKGALQLEPESALIHAGLAELYGTRALYRALAALPEAGDLNRASEQADRAVALDPKLVQGYVARATIAVARQNYPEAERLLRDSLALAPNDALALNRLGDVMISAGRLDAGLEYYQRALQLDPLSAFMVRDVVRESIYAHRFQEAIEVQQRFDAATPQDTWSAVGVCHAQIQLGLAEQARAKLKASLPNFTPESYPGPGIVEWVFVLREAKLEAESEALAKQLLAHYGPDTYIHALVLMARGRTEEALSRLKPFPPGSQDRLYWSPIFDPVRDDPRFLRKVKELGVAAEYKVARETLARMLKEQAVKK